MRLPNCRRADGRKEPSFQAGLLSKGAGAAHARLPSAHWRKEPCFHGRFSSEGWPLKRRRPCPPPDGSPAEGTVIPGWPHRRGRHRGVACPCALPASPLAEGTLIPRWPHAGGFWDPPPLPADAVPEGTVVPRRPRTGGLQVPVTSGRSARRRNLHFSVGHASESSRRPACPDGPQFRGVRALEGLKLPSCPAHLRKEPSFHGGRAPAGAAALLPHPSRGIALTPAYFLSRLQAGRSGPPP